MYIKKINQKIFFRVLNSVSGKKIPVFEVESGNFFSGLGSFGNVTPNWLFFYNFIYFLDINKKNRYYLSSFSKSQRSIRTNQHDLYIIMCLETKFNNFLEIIYYYLDEEGSNASCLSYLIISHILYLHYLHFQSLNYRSKPFNMISILKYGRGWNFIIFEFFLFFLRWVEKSLFFERSKNNNFVSILKNSKKISKIIKFHHQTYFSINIMLSGSDQHFKLWKWRYKIWGIEILLCLDRYKITVILWFRKK